MNSSKIICSPGYNNIANKSLHFHLQSKRREYLKWITYCGILLIILADISNKCPFDNSNWYYLEYGIAGFIALRIFLYFVKYFYYFFNSERNKVTETQKIDDNCNITNPTAEKFDFNLLSMSASLHSSFNDSNRTMSSPNWSYSHNTSQCVHRSNSPIWNSSYQSMSPLNRSTASNISMTSLHNKYSNDLNMSTSSNNVPFTSPYKKYSNITDEKQLQQYLKEFSKQEYNLSDNHITQNNFSSPSINSLWSYCNTSANALKTSLYQVSPSEASPNKQNTKDESGLFGTKDLDGNSEIIKKISSAKLSKYLAKLRLWISCTILQRLETEINKIDAAFKSRGYSDIQIGSVVLERLKKAAENQQIVLLHVPMLPLIVPFLEMSTNQEYLVQRIKDLAKSSWIAGYRWNSGSSYHGLNWDEHLPTDSAIVFHLFCSYLDSQLYPLPQPGGRPFYNRYVIIGDNKSAKELISEVKNVAGCAILCTNLLKPKFNFISDGKIHTCAHDRNNLFYVILQFLIYIKNHHAGLLEGVHLGKSGINILCVIED